MDIMAVIKALLIEGKVNLANFIFSSSIKYKYRYKNIFFYKKIIFDGMKISYNSINIDIRIIHISLFNNHFFIVNE